MYATLRERDSNNSGAAIPAARLLVRLPGRVCHDRVQRHCGMATADGGVMPCGGGR